MSLQQWLDNGWLITVRPSREVVSNLLAIADREIADGSLEGISRDGRFDHAYDAVRSLCEAALHAAGYAVPKGTRKHERTIESLQFTVDADWTEKASYLDRCRRRRHQTVYERMGAVQQRDADELLETAKELSERVRAWLRTNHPGLIG